MELLLYPVSKLRIHSSSHEFNHIMPIFRDNFLGWGLMEGLLSVILEWIFLFLHHRVGIFWIWVNLLEIRSVLTESISIIMANTLRTKFELVVWLRTKTNVFLAPMQVINHLWDVVVWGFAQMTSRSLPIHRHGLFNIHFFRESGSVRDSLIWTRAINTAACHPTNVWDFTCHRIQFIISHDQAFFIIDHVYFHSILRGSRMLNLFILWGVLLGSPNIIGELGSLICIGEGLLTISLFRVRASFSCLCFFDSKIFLGFLPLYLNIFRVIIVADFDLDRIFVLTRQHHLSRLKFFFWNSFCWPPQLFHSVSIS